MTFSERLLDLALSIPPGRVTTYGQLAKAAGAGPLAARSVTAILSKYPNSKAIPWHRIVYANGKVWLPEANKEERIKMYAKEEIFLDKNNKIIDFEDLVFDFTEL